MSCTLIEKKTHTKKRPLSPIPENPGSGSPRNYVSQFSSARFPRSVTDIGPGTRAAVPFPVRQIFAITCHVTSHFRLPPDSCYLSSFFSQRTTVITQDGQASSVQNAEMTRQRHVKSAPVPCVCAGKEEPDKQICCHECTRFYHFWCLPEPLHHLPPQDEEWFCPSCKNNDLQLIKQRDAAYGSENGQNSSNDSSFVLGSGQIPHPPSQ
jgi:hypothetical protein